MTTKAKPDPKGQTAAAPTLDHDCCGGGAAARNDVSKFVDHEDAVPSKVAGPSCCTGTSKDRGQAEPEESQHRAKVKAAKLAAFGERSTA
jgi:hypothetical protein